MNRIQDILLYQNFLLIATSSSIWVQKFKVLGSRLRLNGFAAARRVQGCGLRDAGCGFSSSFGSYSSATRL